MDFDYAETKVYVEGLASHEIDHDDDDDDGCDGELETVVVAAVTM